MKSLFFTRNFLMVDNSTFGTYLHLPLIILRISYDATMIILRNSEMHVFLSFLRTVNPKHLLQTCCRLPSALLLWLCLSISIFCIDIDEITHIDHIIGTIPKNKEEERRRRRTLLMVCCKCCQGCALVCRFITNLWLIAAVV